MEFNIVNIRNLGISRAKKEYRSCGKVSGICIQQLHLATTLLNNNSMLCYSTLEVSEYVYARE